jgi:hypothetical protein
MGAGILPTAIHNNKLYFLFGKENKYEDSASGYSDFGGGTDHKETFFETAIREGTEELTGFLGSEKDLRTIMKRNGTYSIDYTCKTHSPYRMFIIPFLYDELLPHYYNNNQKFLQKRLDPKIIKETKIFEKAEIRWICVDDIIKMKKQFRSYFQNIVEVIYNERNDIYNFISKSSLKKANNKKTRKNRK